MRRTAWRPTRDLARVYDAVGDSVNVAEVAPGAIASVDDVACTRAMLDGLRVLEIGHATLFARALPHTTLLWTGRRDPPVVAGRVMECGLASIAGVARALRAGAFDLVVCHAPPVPPSSRAALRRVVRRARRARRMPMEPFALVLARMCGRAPLALLDLEDTPPIAGHVVRLARAATTVFKRELDPGHAPATSTARPITLGLSRERLAAADAAFAAQGGRKNVDVFFAGAVRDGDRVRRRGVAQLAALRERGCVVDVAAGRLPPPEYMRRIAGAWLTWSPPGLGWDCFRHYEAAACGSVPLLSTPTIVRHRPLADGVHALVYDPEGDELARVVVSALADRERLARIALAAREHVRAHHTHRALCAYVAAETLGRNP